MVSVTVDDVRDGINDTESNLEFGLGGSNKAVFTGCKWEKVVTPTLIEDLIALKAGFVAKGPVSIT